MLIALLAGCAYDVPLDPDADEVQNVISGEIVVSGTQDVGNVMVLLFAADDPPPPTGTGRPLNFATVPASAFTGSNAGMQSAPYALTHVPDGEWLVVALMDMDGDFQPLLTSNSGSTCGDWLGAHLEDVTTGEYAPVSVEGGVLLDDVTVAIGTQISVERPAFTISDPATVDGSAPTGTPEGSFTLNSTTIASELIDITGPYDGTDVCDTTFWFYAPDENEDGNIDAHTNPDLAAHGAYQVWPKVYLIYQGELEEGEDWRTEAQTDPLPVLLGLAQLGVPTPMSSINVFFPPGALHTHPDGTEELIFDQAAIPRGVWSITVVQYTGQSWTIPNEVAEFDVTDDTFDNSLQAGFLTVE